MYMKSQHMLWGQNCLTLTDTNCNIFSAMIARKRLKILVIFQSNTPTIMHLDFLYAEHINQLPDFFSDDRYKLYAHRYVYTSPSKPTFTLRDVYREATPLVFSSASAGQVRGENRKLSDALPYIVIKDLPICLHVFNRQSQILTVPLSCLSGCVSSGFLVHIV